MIIQIDTREKSRAIQKILQYLNENNIKYVSSKMICGDYCDISNPLFCIDRKQNLNEVCNNVCQNRKRFIAELERAKELGIRLVFLIEHSAKIKCLEDVRFWKNPRLKEHPLALSGERLYKILSVVEKTYNTKFYFCCKNVTGREIVKLLEEEQNEKYIKVKLQS
ncbi:ERCC4 domain-containing protein [Ruminococcus sp.]|uniref:ERCC4 domain-containing protein n=1 Tax=Ruminococcus sp. TaxID=41978 RepID=UPI0025F05028|nr:ERCC4 domain-containing protein [Ruminococcus sp.]